MAREHRRPNEGCRITKVENTMLHCATSPARGASSGHRPARPTATSTRSSRCTRPTRATAGALGARPDRRASASAGWRGTCAADPDDLPATPEASTGIFSADGAGAGQGKLPCGPDRLPRGHVRDKDDGDHSHRATATTSRRRTRGVRLASSMAIDFVGTRARSRSRTSCRVIFRFAEAGRSGQHRRAPPHGLTSARAPASRACSASSTSSGASPSSPASRRIRRTRTAHGLAVELRRANLDAGKFISEFLGPIDQAGQGGHRTRYAGGRDDPGRGPDHLGPLEAGRPGAGDGARPARGHQRQRPLADALDPADDPVRQLAAGRRQPADPARRLGPGKFTVNTQRAPANSAPIPEEADKGIDEPVARDGPRQTSSRRLRRRHRPSDDEAAPVACDRGATFGVCGLTFPFLGDAARSSAS